MRLISYGPFGRERAGFLEGDQIIDLEQAMKALGAESPASDMRLFLEQPDWRAMLDRAHAARAKVAPVPRPVRLGAPVPVPRSLIIAGANTKTHIAEAGTVLGETVAPREPMLLAKATSCICGPNDDIVHPPETRKLDYEVELAVVIGRKARRIEEKNVKEYVAGFAVSNEVSARDIQLAEHETNPFFRTHYIGKSFDTFCPLGPALVTVDEFSWGSPLRMSTKPNFARKIRSQRKNYSSENRLAAIFCSDTDYKRAQQKRESLQQLGRLRVMPTSDATRGGNVSNW